MDIAQYPINRNCVKSDFANKALNYFAPRTQAIAQATREWLAKFSKNVWACKGQTHDLQLLGIV
jgi:hypothetical protein